MHILKMGSACVPRISIARALVKKREKKNRVIMALGTKEGRRQRLDFAFFSSLRSH